MARSLMRRRKALHSVSERRRQCRKRNHMRIVQRSKSFLAGVESPQDHDCGADI